MAEVDPVSPTLPAPTTPKCDFSPKRLRSHSSMTRASTHWQRRGPLQRYVSRIETRLQNAWSRGRRLPRSPFVRIWPPVREVFAVMLLSVALVLLAPSAFDSLPPPFGIRSGDSPADQVLAALAGASVAAAAFLVNFTLHGLMYVYRWSTARHLLVWSWIAVALGLPLTLLLTRCCAAAGAPLDVPTLALVVWNGAMPGALLAQMDWLQDRFEPARRVYGALLAALMAWVLAAIPYQVTAYTTRLLVDLYTPPDLWLQMWWAPRLQLGVW